MSFHTGQTFTFGETPSATKWNYLWENDYALADGTGIEDDAIDSRHIVDAAVDPIHHAIRYREVPFPHMGADSAGGATLDLSDGPAIAFTGTPAAFARLTGRIPDDYAGGDVEIKLYFRSSATNNNETTIYYLTCQSVGEVYSAWNIASGITSQTVSFSSTISVLTLTNVIPDANADVGDIVQLAWRPTSALSGTVYLVGATMRYQSNS